MQKWHCYKDKVEMVEDTIRARYLEMTRYIPGLKCPICGRIYLTERMALQLREDEEMLEPK